MGASTLLPVTPWAPPPRPHCHPVPWEVTKIRQEVPSRPLEGSHLPAEDEAQSSPPPAPGCPLGQAPRTGLARSQGPKGSLLENPWLLRHDGRGKPNPRQWTRQCLRQGGRRTGTPCKCRSQPRLGVPEGFARPPSTAPDSSHVSAPRLTGSAGAAVGPHRAWVGGATAFLIHNKGAQSRFQDSEPEAQTPETGQGFPPSVALAYPSGPVPMVPGVSTGPRKG